MNTSSVGWITAAAAAAIFVFDVFTPHGVAVPMLYVIPILLSWLIPGFWITAVVTGCSLLLTTLAIVFSPGEPTIGDEAERAITSALLFIVAGLLLVQKRSARQIGLMQQARFEMAQIAYKQGPGAIADIMVPKLLSPTTIQTRQELVQRVRRMIEGNQVSGIAGDLMSMAERPDSIPLLQQIICPAQIIVGELDVPTPPSDARLMTDRIPNARLAVIPGAGHLSNLEQPKLFNEAIRSFGLTLTR